MTHDLCRYLLPIVTCAMCVNMLHQTNASEPLVFISAFAPGDKGAIHAYSLDLNAGEMKLLHRTVDVEYPFFMAISADHRFLYSIHAPGKFGGDADEQVAAFKVIGQTGQLQLLNRQSSLGSASCYLDVDATGKSVIAANYLTGSVTSLPVRKDGGLEPSSSFFQHAGSSVNVERQSGPHAHCSVVSPDNRFVLVADLGLDQILIYRLESTKGKLTPHRPAFVETLPGAGPRHLTFHPNGRYVYVVNELSNSVTLFDWESKPGTLIEQQTISTLPNGFDGTSQCADVKVTPNGRFLYVTNRGHDSVAAYRIGHDGRLTLLEIEPSLGAGPQNLAITQDGRLLLCANMPGDNVVLVRIDQQTGQLTPFGKPVSISSPSCIIIL